MIDSVCVPDDTRMRMIVNYVIKQTKPSTFKNKEIRPQNNLSLWETLRRMEFVDDEKNFVLRASQWYLVLVLT